MPRECCAVLDISRYDTREHARKIRRGRLRAGDLRAQCGELLRFALLRIARFQPIEKLHHLTHVKILNRQGCKGRQGIAIKRNFIFQDWLTALGAAD